MVFWIALSLPCLMLMWASICATRLSSKIGALGGLGLLLIPLFFALILALAGADAGAAEVRPSPLMLGMAFLALYGAVAWLALCGRRLRRVIVRSEPE